MKTRPSAPSNFATSDAGQGYYDLLTTFGRTPREWGALDPHERRFLEAAHDERARREAEEHDDLDDSY